MKSRRIQYIQGFVLLGLLAAVCAAASSVVPTILVTRVRFTTFVTAANRVSPPIATVAAALFAAVGILCVFVEELTDQPLVLGGRFIRRSLGREALDELSPPQRDLVMRIWPGLRGELPYEVNRTFGWRGVRLKLVHRAGEVVGPADDPVLGSRSGSRELSLVEGGGQASSDGGVIEETATVVAPSLLAGGPTLLGRLCALCGFDLLEIARSQRRGYGQKARRDLRDMTRLLSHVSRNGGSDIKARFEQAQRARALLGASRSAVLVGSVLGLSYSVVRIEELSHHAGVLIALSAFAVAAVDLAWILCITVPMRRREWQKARDHLGPEVRDFLLVPSNFKALREMAVSAEDEALALPSADSST
jgi:hypothetical protein